MPAIVIFNNDAPPNDQNGVSAAFEVPNDGQYLLYATGSGFLPETGLIQIGVSLNEEVIGIASVCTNEVYSHKSVVPLTAIVTLQAGLWFGAMTAESDTKVDVNDRFTMTLVAL